MSILKMLLLSRVRQQSRRFIVGAILILCFFSVANIEADSILFFDGRTLQGVILDRNQTSLDFQLPDGKIERFAVTEIRRASYALSGLRVCYTLRVPDSARGCSALLRHWRKKEIVVTRGPDYRKEETIPLDDIREAEVWINDKQNAAPYLTGMQIRGEVELKDHRILRGSIQEQSSVLRISDYSSSVDIPGSSLSRIVMKERESLFGVALKDFFPGYRRWNDDRSTLGLATMCLFTGSTLSSIYFWQASTLESNRAAHDRTTILFNNQTYLEKYQSQRRVMTGTGLFATGLFALNAVDILWIRGGSRISSGLEYSLAFSTGFYAEKGWEAGNRSGMGAGEGRVRMTLSYHF